MATNALIPLPAASDLAASSAALALLDPSNLGTLPWVPLIPERQRRQHHVFVSADHRFKAAARFLQALWREDRNLAIGRYPDNTTSRRRRLGSRISMSAGGDGANFLHPCIIPVVAQALHYREPGAVYDVDRLKTNLLSSQPLTFNLFGLLARDFDLATRFIADLLPGAMAEVTDLLFEHSPSRGDPRFTADGTAFDLAIRGRSATGERVFIGIEVKYSESAYEPAPRCNERYATLAPTTDLFIDAADPGLVSNPCQQLYRQHCLAASILDQGLADHAILAFIAPSHNHLAQTAATTYVRHLHSAATGRIPFIPLTLERTIAALATAGLPDHARALHRRYLDWWLVDGELHLDDVSAAASNLFTAAAFADRATRRSARAA
ncbi:hypothetical protein ASF49_20915 [Methylobacterium sp. Leaf104]|uniref:PGN_0703 family putative restriction endonuclease n=1 Tax=Methylobacterium TaxID=407 RepID=UPI0006F8EA4E|nr:MULTISPECIES: hypothetical protein [Methylobacterium]KQP40260.1 hypothetical protein ASF49_20915 [Methylobacterium sp. Leaf104]MCI9882624.1 hypothetical protein [Methylobacterium goesingense]